MTDVTATETETAEESPAFSPDWEIPVDYKIKSHLGLSRGDLTVYDADGTLAFRVTGGRSVGSSHPGVKVLFDASDTPLISVVDREDGWQGFRGNCWEGEDSIFTVQKMQYSTLKTELQVFLSDGNLGDPKSSYTLKGSPFHRSCTIYRDSSIIAQTSLLYKLRKVIYSRRKFRLTVFPGNDHALAIAMLVIFLGGS